MPDFNLTATKNMYNVVQGNKTEFIKQFQSEYKTANPYEAEKWFNYMASMDTDGAVGLTPDEHKQGLAEKKDLAEIKRDKIFSQYVAAGDEEKFAKMSQEEKLAYIESKIPHEPGREAEAHIQASIVLSGLNRIDNEIGLLKEALGEYGKIDETPKSPEDKAAERAGNDYMKGYIQEDDLPKFNKMTRDEQLEYLTTHIAHKPGASEKMLRASAEAILLERDVIQDQAKEIHKAKAEIGKQMKEAENIENNGLE